MKNYRTLINNNNRGFTLIELLIVIAIIGILASVVLVSLNSARTKAKDNKALATMRGVQASAQMCMFEKTTAPYIRINYPTNPTNKTICKTSSESFIAGYSEWPDISNTGWSYYFWCLPGYDGASAPASCGGYSNSLVCGGDYVTGKFCYGITNGVKRIWCTEKGCKKSGF